jgi:hypothetical protein
MISRELEKRRSFLKLIPNLVSMKIPFAVKSFIAIALLAHLVSCEDSKTPEGTTQKKRTTEEQARDIEFGPWMSNAGLMFAQEQLAPEDYFAEIEGRVIKGENQYRAITKTLNTDEILRAEAIWGWKQAHCANTRSPACEKVWREVRATSSPIPLARQFISSSWFCRLEHEWKNPIALMWRRSKMRLFQQFLSRFLRVGHLELRHQDCRPPKFSLLKRSPNRIQLIPLVM